MNLNALKVDPEFQGKIPPLTFEELNQLKRTSCGMAASSTPSSYGRS